MSEQYYINVNRVKKSLPAPPEQYEQISHGAIKQDDLCFDTIDEAWVHPVYDVLGESVEPYFVARLKTNLKLKPVDNFRYYKPRVCGHCNLSYYDAEGGVIRCERPLKNGNQLVIGNTGDGIEWESTCDGWLPQPEMRK